MAETSRGSRGGRGSSSSSGGSRTRARSPSRARSGGSSASARKTAARKGGKARDYVLHARDGQVTIEEARDAPEADARVSGSQAAWVAALGPDRDRGGLDVTGDRRLVEALLDGLSAAGLRNSAAA